MAKEKLIFIRTRYHELDDKEHPGQKIQGYWIDFLSRSVDPESRSWRVNIESQFVRKSDTHIIDAFRNLVPGMYFEFNFVIEGRKNLILESIIPGDVAVDFDDIL